MSIMESLAFDFSTNPHIFVIQPNNAVGWGAVENAVREDDEQQVNDCKDDINTLLTFAGLYSAALTALLALAFNMLQEDVASESLQVLRQISQQTAAYRMLPGGMLNTSVHLPPSPPTSPFQPSERAIRVNVLWFASLTLSLATASIGITVKQWLRAYTTYATSSARGRMRIRHFRHEGLKKWKVFEIAAALPYLIQLALGLFFVGLCYFTAEVDPRLGHTTLPLVSAWALFLLMTFLFPFVSSQCPYKAASLERGLSVIRRGLFSSLTKISVLPCYLKERATRRTPNCPESYRPFDEADAADYTGKDTLILSWADVLQSDDELLGTGILEALSQSQLGHEQVIDFILRAISDRSQAMKVSVNDEPTTLDCLSLTPRACTAIVDILSHTTSDYVLPRLKDQSLTWTEKTMQWPICILLSVPNLALPPSGLRFLGRCLMIGRNASENVAKCLCMYIEKGPALKLSLKAVQHVCRKDFVDLARVVDHIKLTLEYYFSLAKLPDTGDTAAVFPSGRQDKLQEWGQFLNKASLTETVSYLADVHRQQLQVKPARFSTPRQRNLLDSIYSLIFRLSATIIISDTRAISADLMEALENVGRECAAKQDLATWKSMLWAMIIQPPVFMSTGSSYVLRSLSGLGVNGLKVFQPAVQEVAKTRGGMHLGSAVNLCYAALYLLPFEASELKDQTIFNVWRSIFEDLGQLLQGQIAGVEDKGRIELSERSAELLEEILSWLRRFERGHPVFDDRFDSAIAKLVPDEHDTYWPRTWRQIRMRREQSEVTDGQDAGDEDTTANGDGDILC